MKEKIPCGGFYYDTESIEFENGIMKAKGGSTKQSPFVTIGTSTAGFTEQDVDFLCNGTNDAEVIQTALDTLLPTGMPPVVYIYQGSYNITSDVTILTNHVIVGIGKPEIHTNGSLLINGSNVLIENITIYNTNTCQSIIISNSSHIDINACYFRPLVGNYPFIIVNNSEQINITNNFFQNSYTETSSPSTSILITTSSKYVSVSNNILYGLISINNYSSFNTISHNLLKSAYIELEMANYNIISYNINSAIGSPPSVGTLITISGGNQNTIDNNKLGMLFKGISATSTNGLKVTNNSCLLCRECICSVDGSDNMISNNNFGIDPVGSSKGFEVKTSGNIISDNFLPSIAKCSIVSGNAESNNINN